MADICAGITGFCVWVGSLVAGTLFGKALCFGSLKPRWAGPSLEQLRAGGRWGHFPRAPRSWDQVSCNRGDGQADGWPEQSQWQVLDDVRGSVAVFTHVAGPPRYLVSTHHGGVHSCLTVGSPTLSTCLWALSFQRWARDQCRGKENTSVHPQLPALCRKTMQ